MTLAFAVGDWRIGTFPGQQERNLDNNTYKIHVSGRDFSEECLFYKDKGTEWEGIGVSSQCQTPAALEKAWGCPGDRTKGYPQIPQSHFWVYEQKNSLQDPQGRSALPYSLQFPTAAKRWMPSKWPPVEERINQMWYIQESIIQLFKGREFWHILQQRRTSKTFRLSEIISQSQKRKYYTDSTYIAETRNGKVDSQDWRSKKEN